MCVFLQPDSLGAVCETQQENSSESWYRYVCLCVCMILYVHRALHIFLHTLRNIMRTYYILIYIIYIYLFILFMHVFFIYLFVYLFTYLYIYLSIFCAKCKGLKTPADGSVQTWGIAPRCGGSAGHGVLRRAHGSFCWHWTRWTDRRAHHSIVAVVGACWRMTLRVFYNSHWKWPI